MSGRQRMLLLVLIMTTISFVIIGTTTFFLYDTAFEQTKERLKETAQSQARLIEAVARFDAAYTKDYPEGYEAATLSQIIDAYRSYKGFGKTGEFTLARLERDNIVFLLSHRHFDLDHPRPVPFESQLAEPIRRALSGQSGTVIGPDYRGETVMAAYEPVAELNLGIVAKIDLAEVQAPFLKATLMALCVSALFILGGTALFFRISNPMVKRLEKHSRDVMMANERMMQEIEERKLMENDLKWELTVNSSLTKIYEPLTNPLSSIEGIAKTILDCAKALIESKHGYVSSIDPLTGDNIVHTFTEIMKDQCRVAEGNKKLAFPKGEDGLYRGLWGHALNTGEAFFSNSPEAHEASAGVPEGHIILENFLTVPVRLGNELVGQIALANKKEEYTERDLDATCRIGDYYALAIQHKRVEEAVRNEKENLANILDTMKDGVYIVNQDYDIEYINPPFEAEFGSVAGRKCYRYFHGREEVCPWCKSKDVFEGNSVRWEWYSPKNQRTYDLVDTPLRNPDSSISKLTIFHDITDLRRAQEILRKEHNELEKKVEERTIELLQSNILLKQEIAQREQTEKQLERSKDMLQEVFDGTSDPLVLLDFDLRIKMINKSAVEYYGVTDVHEVVGKFCYHAFKGRSELCEECKACLAISQGENITFERKGFMDQGRFELVIVDVLEREEDQKGDAILRINDITERKLFERQLIQSEKMASLGVLVSSIAHEINNPNSFIGFNMPILKEYVEELIHTADYYAADHPDFELSHLPYTEFRKDIFNLIDNITHGSERISSFVSNLREFSRSEYRGKLSWIDLMSVIEKVLSICRVKVGKTIKSLTVDVQEDFPKIYSDPYALEHILINLIINAAQASDKVNSWVKLSASVGNTWVDRTIIEVRDNGCGIDENDIKHIFDPFFSTKSPAEGTGLGLYVCHDLVEGLGGFIEVESEVGEYSAFRVILPDIERRSKSRK